MVKQTIIYRVSQMLRWSGSFVCLYFYCVCLISVCCIYSFIFCYCISWRYIAVYINVERPATFRPMRCVCRTWRWRPCLAPSPGLPVGRTPPSLARPTGCRAAAPWSGCSGRHSEQRSSTPVKGKGSPYSITKRRVPQLIPVLGSQPASDVNHKPHGRLPLLSVRSLQ